MFILTFILVSCSSPPSNLSTPTTQSNSVIIQNFAFSPSTLTIKTGTTVTWTNEDSAPHSIKSTDFNSDTLQPGDTFPFTFDKPGMYTYQCGIHPSMKATIVVE